MSLSTLGIDAYQLTTLLAHADAGRLEHQVGMSVFFRRLPANRRYVVFAGLRALLTHASEMAISEGEMEVLLGHPVLGPALRARPAVREALLGLRGFEGEIDALPEGTLAFAGPGFRTDGRPFEVAGTRVQLYTPLCQVRTDLVRAKLIETPWLGRINHLSMVASKAARIVDAAAGRPVSEFGQRRTHPAAAVDAAWAAYLAGCSSTSNVAAHLAHGIPVSGTMDHFAVQASERPGVPPEETEGEFFATFARAFPENATLLVDTYDTERGLRRAVEATSGALTGVRIDSSVTPESVRRARRILDEAGAPHARIYVSDALDEHRVAALAATGVVDGFGVGENITCSPDAATGVGAVAKLTFNGYGKATMKLSRGSGKASLPGPLQAYRFGDHDLIALGSEPPPDGGEPLLQPVWRGPAQVVLPSLEESRARVRAQVERLPPHLRRLDEQGEPWPLVASDALRAEVERLVGEALSVAA